MKAKLDWHQDAQGAQDAQDAQERESFLLSILIPDRAFTLFHGGFYGEFGLEWGSDWRKEAGGYDIESGLVGQCIGVGG
jgi:hypothetical protein